MNQLSQFIDVFGMRYVGLVDPSSTVYSSWRVPQPLAPYPQDYIIDQEGRVAYWSDQFDAQEVMRTIDRLLATGVEERSTHYAIRTTLEVSPNPCRGVAELRVQGVKGSRGQVANLGIYDASGRAVIRQSGIWNLVSGISLDLLGLRSGIYLIRLSTQDQTLSCRFALLH